MNKYKNNFTNVKNIVGGAGFEPAKKLINGFTVRPSWPLWYPPN